MKNVVFKKGMAKLICFAVPFSAKSILEQKACPYFNASPVLDI